MKNNKKLSGFSDGSSIFEIGQSVIYDGHVCIVKKKEGHKCLGLPMPVGWSYFIPHWPAVKSLKDESKKTTQNQQ